MKDRDGVAVNGGRVKEEHLNNEMKKEKQKNLECSAMLSKMMRRVKP